MWVTVALKANYRVTKLRVRVGRAISARLLQPAAPPQRCKVTSLVNLGVKLNKASLHAFVF